jgi:hypothetical protein
MRQLRVARLREAVRFLVRRPWWLAVIALGLGTSAGLLVYASLTLSDGIANAALNLGTEVLGALITVAIVGPIIRYVQEGHVREHPRLDYEWFMAQAAAATTRLQILTTFSNALEQPLTERFFRALGRALSQQAQIEILLLNPGSLAAKQRQQELQGATLTASSVQREILRNIRRLHDFAARLDSAERRYFAVRLYDASASITLYRWDDRALVSFLPIGRLSEYGTQLEVAVRSPLGEFVEQRFRDLWSHASTKTLDEFMYLRVTLAEDDRMARDFAARYVMLDDTYYLVHTEILAAMARRRAGVLMAYCGDDASQLHELVIVDNSEPNLHESLVNDFIEKYDVRAHAFVGLKPLAHTS